jgi:elongation factor Ts
MAEITAALVKQLREQTGAGMMDCKRALTETGGDYEAAVDWLRKKGLAAAAKKAGRVAADGLVALRLDGKRGALAEINAETDFVARNEAFQRLCHQVAELALAVIGENIGLRRTAFLEVESGLVAGYMHAQAAPGLGRIGVLVALEADAPAATLEELGKQLAMHVAAANPQALDTASLDPALIARERAVYSEQARASGKPDTIVEKMVEGRLRKFYEESVLLEQAFVIDPDRRVKQVVEAGAKELGAALRVAGFARMALGEGIDKPQDDLATEVAKMTQS